MAHVLFPPGADDFNMSYIVGAELSGVVAGARMKCLEDS